MEQTRTGSETAGKLGYALYFPGIITRNKSVTLQNGSLILSFGARASWILQIFLSSVKYTCTRSIYFTIGNWYLQQ